MPIFAFNKLVRDFITDLQNKDGITPVVRKLDDEEYRKALINKLHEETIEVAEAEPAEVLAELADIQQVLDDLTILSGYTNEERLNKQQVKKEKAGGFSEKIFITEVNIPEDNPWLDYYMQRPSQYPQR